MIRKCAFILSVLLIGGTLYAANKEQKRLENSGVVMQEIMNTPENIPREILEKADCVIVFPSVLKAAFVVGGSYGRGAMGCRTGAEFKVKWDATAMYALSGDTLGSYIGV